MEPVNITPQKEPPKQIAAKPVAKAKAEPTPFDDEPAAAAPPNDTPQPAAPNAWADGMDDEIKFADDAATFRATWNAAIKTDEWAALLEADNDRARRMTADAKAKLAALKAAVSAEIQ